MGWGQPARWTAAGGGIGGPAGEEDGCWGRAKRTEADGRFRDASEGNFLRRA